MGKKLKNKNTIFALVALLLIGLFSGCSNVATKENKESSVEPKQTSYVNITPEDAKKRLENEKGIILLDVRTKEEYDTGHIKNSILIPVDVIKDEAENKLKDKESPIFVYCRSGNRSVTAGKILVDLGYKNVYNLGGISKWPYEVVK